MTRQARERRVCAVEKRLGVTGRPLEQLSDLDLLGAIEAVSLALVTAGNTDAEDTLAQHDAQEAALRAFWQRPDVAGRNSPVLEVGVRWPYLRARARHHEAAAGRDEPRSATSEAELWRKIVASSCLESARC
jgi:hypothetical protein